MADTASIPLPASPARADAFSGNRRALLGWIDAERDAIIGFLSGLLQCRSANPPGDTRSAARFVADWLAEQGLDSELVEPRDTLVSVFATQDFPSPGRHLVLNGHIDVWPPYDDDGWSGEVRDGRIHGRGAADMKAGSAALIIAYAYMSRLSQDLKGRLTLTAVADEQTGGKWGTRWLIENRRDEVLGDCCLNGEPSGLTNIRFAEKGTLRFTVTIDTPGGHGGYPHVSKSAIKLAATVIERLEALHGLKPDLPHNIESVITSPAAVEAAERGMGAGAAEVMRSMVVNIGTIQGGLKVNQLPGHCVFEAEVRIPMGFNRRDILQRVESMLADMPEARIEVMEAHSYDPSWCDPDCEMARNLRRNIEDLTGFKPVPLMSLGGSDTRYWRWEGVPAVFYGPSPVSMGGKDEYVTVDEYLHIVRTLTLSAYDYLASPAG